MSTYAFMRLLESAPRRYDLGMKILSFGRLGKSYDRITSSIQPGQRVLDIGCGTGELTLRAARRGAQIKAIDVNAAMLNVARDRARREQVADRIAWEEVGVAELDCEPSGSYDAVTSGLCFSELTADELSYAIKEIGRVLKPGGLLLVVDEVRPPVGLRRILHFLIRALTVPLTYLLTQQTTHPIADLADKVSAAGFEIRSQRVGPLASVAEIVASRPC